MLLSDFTQRQRPQVWAATGKRAKEILHWTGKTEREEGTVLKDLSVPRRRSLVMVYPLVGSSVEKMIATFPYLLQVVKVKTFELRRIVIEYRSCEGIVHNSRQAYGGGGREQAIGVRICERMTVISRKPCKI